MTRAILGLKLSDTQCGAKFFRKSALDCILHKVTLTNWAFDASVLFHMSRAGFTIREVSVKWTDHPASKLRVEKVVPAMLLSVIGIRLMSIDFLPNTTRRWAKWLYHNISIH